MSRNKVSTPKITDIVNEMEMGEIFRKEQIIIERVELFRDFCVALHCTIDGTYFGPDFIKTDYDIDGHFNWCFKNIIKQYKKASIVFSKTEIIYNFLKKEYLEKYYSVGGKKSSLSKKYWQDIFIFATPRKRNDFKLMVELYKYFNKTINDR